MKPKSKMSTSSPPKKKVLLSQSHSSDRSYGGHQVTKKTKMIFHFFFLTFSVKIWSVKLPSEDRASALGRVEGALEQEGSGFEPLDAKGEFVHVLAGPGKENYNGKRLKQLMVGK